MKKVVRAFFIALLSLHLVNLVAGGLVFEKGIETFLLAGVGLAIALLFARPVINILLLPLNLITFGLFRWLSSAIALYLVTLVVPGFKIEGFYFSGISSRWFDIPEINIQGLISFVLFAFLLSFITSFIYWVRK